MSQEESKPLDSLGVGRKPLIFGGGGVLALAAILGVVLAARSSPPAPAAAAVAATPSASAVEDAAPPGAGEPGEAVPTGSASAAPAAPAVSAPVSENVQVTVRVFPAVQATVTMGKARLGTIAPRGSLVLPRRRDSGPLDLVIRSAGYVTVHTRAYTFSDNTIEVRLTRLDKKDTLYGYRTPLPPEDEVSPVSSAEPIRSWVPLSQLLGGAAPSAAPPAVPPPTSSSSPR